jgi:hypothetical protein
MMLVSMVACHVSLSHVISPRLAVIAVQVPLLGRRLRAMYQSRASGCMEHQRSIKGSSNDDRSLTLECAAAPS